MPGESAVAGSPVARRLVRDAAAGSPAVRRVDVVGAGGHGKTVLLEALARAFEAAGLAVRGGVPPTAEPLAPAVAVLVDD
ncbi:MAG TPA: hypothetical protein VEZ42_09355, partial [Pseudonocardia sp.]|nr:hypothetical protein [Pseudonocardia sp.]